MTQLTFQPDATAIAGAAVAALVVVALPDPQAVEKLQHRQKARLAVLLDTSKSMNT
jgi:hypothetical protein